MVPTDQLSQIPDFDIVTGSDGRQYKIARSQLSPVQSATVQPTPTYPWQYTGGQFLGGGQTPASNGLTGQFASRSVPDQARERMQGIVNLVDVEGARKQSKLIDYVKKCPAKWCKNVKPSSMNLPVYGYGAIAELTASLSGRSEPLPEKDLLSKLSHLQNVFEICCINSTEAELTSYGWTVARDYALKVNERVDQQLQSWGNLSLGIQTDILVSSQMEFPRPHKSREDPRNQDRKTDKPLCTTFNKCTTEGKCDWEVSNPGRVCQRRHECSYCRQTKNLLRKHQESRCASKAAADK